MNMKIFIFFAMSANLFNCKSVSSSQGKAILTSEDGTYGLLDAGVYISPIPTTTRGEIHSKEYSNRRWSGDIAIKRNKKGYSKAALQSESIHGYFFLKMKPLSSRFVSAPKRITILTGKIPDVSESYPNGCIDFPEFETSGHPVVINDNAETVHSQNIGLCEGGDMTDNLPFHKPNTPVYMIPIIPDTQGNIKVEIQWAQLNGKLSKYKIEINNLLPYDANSLDLEKNNIPILSQTSKKAVDGTPLGERTIDNTPSNGSGNGIIYLTPTQRKKRMNYATEGWVPDFISCEKTLCEKKPVKQKEWNLLCKQMNDIIAPKYNQRADIDSEQWLEKFDQLNEIALGCNQDLFYSIDESLVSGIKQPIYYNHQNSEIKFVCDQLSKDTKVYPKTGLSTQDCHTMDLDLAKAIEVAFKSAAEKFEIDTFYVSSIYRYQYPNKRYSFHHYGSAFDIHAFKMKDGRYLDVDKIPFEQGGLWDKLGRHFCEYFTEVISPRARDGLHDNHFHVGIRSSAKSIPAFPVRTNLAFKRDHNHYAKVAHKKAFNNNFNLVEADETNHPEYEGDGSDINQEIGLSLASPRSINVNNGVNERCK